MGKPIKGEKMLKRNISESDIFIDIENKYDVLIKTKKAKNLDKLCFSKTKDIAQLKNKNICSKNLENDLLDYRNSAIKDA